MTSLFTAPLVLADVTPAYWQSTALKLLLVLIIAPTGAVVMAMAFLFKMMAWMQSRQGPMEAGLLPRKDGGTGRGELQLVAELVKWLQKEDLIPGRADRLVFKAAPMVVLASTFLLYVAIPAGPDPAIAMNTPGGIFFILAISSLSVIGVLMAGWASSNKYALLGGIRAAGQLIAYELPMVLAVIGVVILAGSFNLQDIVLAQAGFKVLGIPVPFIILQLPLFFVFLTASPSPSSSPATRSSTRASGSSPSSSPSSPPPSPSRPSPPRCSSAAGTCPSPGSRTISPTPSGTSPGRSSCWPR
jgi:NADH-quinone oxidoreductase subunit H